VSAHPGTARTEIGRLGTSTINHLIRRFMPILVRDGVHGARSQVRAAVDEGVRGGEFFGPRFMFLGAPVVETPSRRARDDSDAKALWELSEELTGISFAL
jgi:protochlorophyllide reductase